MNLKIYQIDAFAKTVFEGNPAAVVPLEAWLDDTLMQKIAMENNLSETAYLVKEKAYYRIRWFTPLTEVDMCGHATLSSAFVLFESKSGLLRVRKDGERYVMDFPAQKLIPCETPRALKEAFSQEIMAGYAVKYLEGVIQL
ncbi:PhzF family phenazine biosynthesis protein [Sulfurimonas crateris]|uniref:PhzF family phenazine biosynthesis protein n=1 Tax=Sulfurimonas crateris TaxID=2574727 RepID=A0A4U2ZBL1_9BACT|nr:PhzF family phenazine biosynthesis isomerase [Sulfurimonas crateris]TKI70940.1 PhzF family phenazine biosynthesis protein [Sulfurimonas crateris]